MLLERLNGLILERVRLGFQQSSAVPVRGIGGTRLG